MTDQDDSVKSTGCEICKCKSQSAQLSSIFERLPWGRITATIIGCVLVSDLLHGYHSQHAEFVKILGGSMLVYGVVLK
jgi:hypothetical protein